MNSPSLNGMREQEFYRSHSPFTDPGDLSGLLVGLPPDIEALSGIVRGVVAHRDETSWLFGFELPEQRRDEARLRHVRAILGLLGDLRERPAETRFAGTCRDFAILLCAMLRASGVPARLRCGFAGYFTLGFFDDHWVVEYWHDEHGWRLADAQIAGAAREAYQVEFDPMDVPRGEFLVAGAAWLACRGGDRDPEVFGVSSANLSGMVEIQGSVVRDLAALNSVETLPWDDWGIIERPYPDLTEEELALLDRAADIGRHGGPFEQALELYRTEPRLRYPGR